ncbi:MAG: SURF1 family protein [Acidiferrobacterales bacterium]
MLIGRYRFRPPLVPTLAVLILLPILLGLGFWQLDRAEQKRTIQAEYDARSQGPEVKIDSALQAADDLRFYRVLVEGNYDPEYEVLIDNRIHAGRAGYHVITPLKLRGSRVRVLVNRGWVPVGSNRQELPQTAAPTGLQKITGVATVPRAKVFMLAEPDPLGEQWQRVWQHMDMNRYAQAVPFPVQPVVVLLDPENAAGGFVREWARLDAGIAVHRGYAVQWFLFATVLLIMYVVLNVKPGASDPDAGT